MKKLKKLFLCFLLLTILIVSGFSQNTGFNEIKRFSSLWELAIDTGNFDSYQTRLNNYLTTNIVENEIPYILSEVLFYKYVGKINYTVNENTQLDENILKFLNDLDIQTASVMSKVAINFFSYFIGENVLPYYEENDNEAVLYEPVTEQDERARLFKAITETEALFKRFLKAKNKSGVAMKFSEKAYLNLLNKPDMIYIIQNVHKYSILNNALLRTKETISEDKENQFPVYSLLNLIETVEEKAAEYDVDISDFLTFKSKSLLTWGHVDPFILYCTNNNDILDIYNELKFLLNIEQLYSNRL